MEMKKKPFNQSIGYLLSLGILAKILIDTTVQIFNPFLPIIAAGVGVSVVQMGKLAALRSLMGLSSPVFGTFADKAGYRPIMRVALLMAGVGMIIAGMFQNALVFAAAMILAGAGQAGYTPTLHAYLSSRLPYEKRARGLGILEYSWALAGIIGLFACGYLIKALSWRAPFFILGGLLICMSFVYMTLPKKKIEKAPSKISGIVTPARPRIPYIKRIRRFLDLGPNAKSAWGTILINGFNFFAMMHVMIIHGGWLAKEYGFGPAQLGSVALLFGICDLVSSVTVSLAVDKIGKRRSVIIGVSGFAAGYAIMPFLNKGIALTLFSLAITRAFFEFAVVSNFPLVSEQVPKQRGKVLAFSMTFGLIGSTIASATGPAAYERFGVWGLAPVGLAASLISLFILIFIVREGSGKPFYNR